ncbi:MAG TPA: hypothetical protein VHS09_16990 [Polyangiaceae bacterium]|nr:hypothetical protein [Polyangiaceae bacterium]
MRTRGLLVGPLVGLLGLGLGLGLTVSLGCGGGTGHDGAGGPGGPGGGGDGGTSEASTGSSSSGGSGGGSSSGSGSSGSGSSGGDAGVSAGDAGGSSDGAAGDAAACSADTKTDAKNCGGCGHDCLGAACADGLCAPEAVGNFGSITNVTPSFALDADNLYVAGDVISGQTAAHVIAAVPRTGGGAPVILSQTTTEQWRGEALVVAGGRVFWSNGDHVGVLSVPTTAKNVAATVVYDDPNDPGPLVGLAVAGSTLYFVQDCGGLYEAPIPTGKGTLVSALGCNSLGLNRMAVDPAGTYVYLTDGGNAQVLTIATASGDENIVASSVSGPMGIAVDAAHVYWTVAGTCTGSGTTATCTGGEIRRATAPSGASALTFIDKIDSTGALGGLGQVTLDATTLYYSVYKGVTNTLYERKLAGGPVVKLATLASFAVPDGDYVYYAGGGEGVSRVAR